MGLLRELGLPGLLGGLEGPEEFEGLGGLRGVEVPVGPVELGGRGVILVSI